jgi:hypothetical protein
VEPSGLNDGQLFLERGDRGSGALQHGVETPDGKFGMGADQDRERSAGRQQGRKARKGRSWLSARTALTGSGGHQMDTAEQQRAEKVP